MQQTAITMEEFQQVCVGTRQYGINVALLRSAEKEHLSVKLSSARQALYKVTTLYGIRKRFMLQVMMRRIGDRIIMGPGEYLPRLRKS